MPRDSEFSLWPGAYSREQINDWPGARQKSSGNW